MWWDRYALKAFRLFKGAFNPCALWEIIRRGEVAILSVAMEQTEVIAIRSIVTYPAPVGS